jgi:hypothetical protein
VPFKHATWNKVNTVRERAERAGCVAFLWKPYRADAILALVRSIADQTHT